MTCKNLHRSTACTAASGAPGLLSLLLLAACGGGGDADPAAPANPGMVVVGGNLSGASGSVVLREAGGEQLTVTAAGNFKFNQPLPKGSAYAVTVAQAPQGQACAVTRGSGTAQADVLDIAVACETKSYPIGVNVGAIAGPVVLRSGDGETLTVSEPGNARFARAVPHGRPYSVAVADATGQDCSLTGASGVADGQLLEVRLRCVAAGWQLGGNIQGLKGGGISLSNGEQHFTTAANGPFSFTGRLADGASYEVKITATPARQACTLGNAKGVARANVENVTIFCVDLPDTPAPPPPPPPPPVIIF